MKPIRLAAIGLLASVLLAPGCRNTPADVERPERIRSQREIIYDSTTYAKLATLWKNYYDAFPSEDAYANWMYAARYAEDPGYSALLMKGVERYPANPILLYLAGMENHLAPENRKGLQLLERSAALDPSYNDAWYGLVVEYLARGEGEKTDAALRRLLNGDAVEDAVMDFSYNMLASLEPDAILITNGDNDTFPGWILTRIVKFRQDARIVNRALLNTDWYPLQIMKEGVPEFITSAGLDSLRKETAADVDRVGKGRLPADEFALMGDRLVGRIVDMGRRTGRPVYFACTVEQNKTIQQYLTQGRRLGLVTLVTPTTETYPAQMRKVLTRWANEFRAGGLDSWNLRAAPETQAGRMLVRNYFPALYRLREGIGAAPVELRLSLFRWYRAHLIDLGSEELLHEVNGMWCTEDAPREIQEWCARMGLRR